MDYLLGVGDNYQWSYEDTAEKVEKYLEFGEIVIDDKGKGFKYSNVSFYGSTDKVPEKVNNKILEWERKCLKKVLKFDY